MASVMDHEKDAETTTAHETSSAGDEEDDKPHLQPLKETPSRRACRRDSNPLEPLEHALTPDLETEAEHDARPPLSLARTTTSIGSGVSRPPDFEVTFRPDDPENPKNWSLAYRAYVLFAVSYSTWVVVFYSTAYSASISGLMEYFREDSETIATLGITTYLLGLAVGSLVVAPLSELYGRRPVYLISLVLFTILVIPCALATSLTEIIVVRFFGALFGAAMISNSPGSVVDIAHQDNLALCMSIWSIAPLNGPVTGPLIGGFAYQYLGWRWDNWLALILGGAAVVIMAMVQETYAPVILKRKAARRRKEEDDDRWWCRYDQRISTVNLLKVNLSRPFVLFWTEPILWFFNIWISVIYGILYLCFVAYPIVFQQHRGWSPGIGGLAFVGIGVGTMISIFLEPLWRWIINSHAKDPETGRAPPEATAAVMSIGAVLTPIGQLVFSWTCLPSSIHWAIPIAFGIPFGMGNTISFIYGSNYLAGSYGIYAASALAGNAVMRSVFGGTLPLAGPTMYATLTPQWAGTLLGLLEVLLIPIPLVFYRYGAKIRSKSRVIRQMREDQAKNEGKRAKDFARMERRAEKRAAADQAGYGDGTGDGDANDGVVVQGTSTKLIDETVRERDVEKGGEKEE